MKCFYRVMLSAFLIFLIAACGVKGDPKPPIEPAELGRGKPSFKRALKKIKIEEAAPKIEDEEDETEDEDAEP